jgi:predicted dinucleotide-binding enzyme
MNFSIIGAGRLGTILAAALVKAGHQLKYVSSSALASAQNTVQLAGQGIATDHLEEVLIATA